MLALRSADLLFRYGHRYPRQTYCERAYAVTDVNYTILSEHISYHAPSCQFILLTKITIYPC